jgi:ubiquinone/menaquinone biosynthesis methyltransferase
MSTTHFGFQSVDEAEKASRVKGVFDSVAPKYDLMNDLMSMGLHRAWKSYAVLVSGVREGQQVLDIAGGTGDLTRAFARKVGKTGRVVHTDINEAMLREGRDRLLDEGLVLPSMVCDAEKLPFASDSFDLVSVAFGLRNMTHKEAALAEMNRVLKPRGKLLVLQGRQAAGEGVRLVFVQGAAAPGQARRGRRLQLPLPCRIDPHASGPAGAEDHDAAPGLRPRGLSQHDRWPCGLACRHQMLKTSRQLAFLNRRLR